VGHRPRRARDDIGTAIRSAPRRHTQSWRDGNGARGDAASRRSPRPRSCLPPDLRGASRSRSSPTHRERSFVRRASGCCA